MAWRLGATVGLVIISSVITLAQPRESKQKTVVQGKIVAVEVFQVIDLPLSIRDVRLVETNKGYVLRAVLSNSTDEQMVGLRYSLVEADVPKPRLITNRIEGFTLTAYSSREMTFQTPIRFRAKDGARLLLMLEQAVTPLDIWEVVKAKEALDAYIAADYSIIPRVIHASNQTDAPLPGRRIVP